MVIEEQMSLRKCAERTGIKFQTLQRYVTKQKTAGIGTNIRLTPNYACRRIFTLEQEATVEEYAVTCAKMCYGKSRKDLRCIAYEVAIANQINVPENWHTNKKAGLEWLLGFMSRHPNLSIRQPEGCSLSRATSFNRHNVDQFFNNLENILNRTPEFADGTRIFNLDETATTTVQKPRKIIAKKGIKQVSSATSGERGILVTTCCVISASGNFIPPVMVFPRKKFKEHMLNGAPSATLGLAHSTGWMTTELFVHVMKHFIHHTASSLEHPSLLIMDSHETHLSVEVLILAKKHGVTVLTLPPHCSNKLQPLDLSVFFSFKSHYNTAIESWLLRNSGRPITIYDIASCVGVAFEKSMTPRNITSGFKKSGIYPFDKHVFTDDDFIVSSVTDRALPEDPMVAHGSNDAEQDIQSIPSISKPTDKTFQSNVPEDTLETDDGYDKICQNETDKIFVSPQILLGYPKAKDLKQKGRSRKRKSIIATDTPEINMIKEKVIERNKKKEAQDMRKHRKIMESKTRLFESSSDDNDDDYQDDGRTSDDLSEEEPTKNLFEFTELEREPNINDFVLVQFTESLKTTIYYIGKILREEENEFVITFLRKSNKCLNAFTFPLEEDVSSTPKKDVNLILSKYLVVGKTKRQQNIIRFEINLSSLNIR